VTAGPLAGLQVVELGGVGPVPFAGMVLADAGASVTAIARPASGPADGLTAATGGVLGRGRTQVTLDLKDAADRAQALELVASADAAVEGFRPGALERLRLGPDVLLAANPALVLGRMTGWGQDGPLAQAPGHDINYLALSGALHAIGTADTPVPPLNLVGDYGGGGMLLAVGLLSGIMEARQSGTGQVVDVATFEGAAMLMTVFYGLFAEGRWEDRRGANLLDGAAHYYRTYETADAEHFAVGAMEPQFYAELCARLGVDLPQEDTLDAWSAHGDTMAARFREKTRAEWEAELVTPQSCASPVLSLAEAPAHEHSRARGSFVTVDGVVQPAPAPRFSRTVPGAPSSPSLAGDHTDAILAELGLDPVELGGAGVVRQSAAG